MSTAKKSRRRIASLVRVGDYVNLGEMVSPALSARWPRFAAEPLKDHGDGLRLEAHVFGHRSDGQAFFIQALVPVAELRAAACLAVARGIVRSYIRLAVNGITREYSYCGCKAGVCCPDHEGTKFGYDPKRGGGAGA